MRTWLVAVTVGALTLSSAQQKTPTASDASALSGTDLIAELSKSVSTKKAKLGDPVKATITQDVLSHGKIVIRRGSKLVGHVTEVKTRSKEDQESRLGLVFDKAILKGGGEIDFNAAVRALAPPMRIGAVDMPDQMGPPTTQIVNQSTAPMPGGSGMPSKSGGSSASPNSNVASAVTNQAARAAEYSAAAGSAEAGGSLMGGGSRGVFGLPGVRLTPEPRGQSVICSTSHNVKLDSGTQMVIQVNNPVQ